MGKSRFFFFLLVLLVSCGRSILSPSAYDNWVKDEKNGLRVSQKMSEYKFTLQYRPKDYIALQEITNSGLPDESFSKIKQELGNMEYFIFRIQAADPQMRVLDIGNEAGNDINSKLNYFSFGMQSDLKLINGIDTLPCALYNFERNYELAPYLDFAIAFDGAQQLKDKKENLVLLFDGDHLGVGPIRFEIDATDQKSIPELKL